jgi:tetratricopeptide (TPR) repeat protein
MHQQKFSQAREAYESVIKVAPNNSAGYFRLGFLQRIRKQYNSALKNYEKALSIDPNRMDVFSDIIMIHTARNEFDTAIMKCDLKLKKITQKPALSSLVYYLKGGVYLASQNKTLAEESFKKAIEQHPDNLKAYYTLAGLYLSQNKQDEAITKYNEVLAANPKQPSAHMLLATIYDMQKRYDLSEKHYRAALEIDPAFVPAANNLAYILADRDKDIDEALSFARLAKGKMPDNPSVMDTLGWVYYKKGLYDSAIDEFNDCLEQMPDNATVTYHLGMAYYKKGELQKARAELEKALQLDASFSGANEAKQILAEL